MACLLLQAVKLGLRQAHEKKGMQDGELLMRRRAMQIGRPPPDLWINAKGIAPAKQQPGFSQLARGSANQQGRWSGTPCSPSAIIKTAFLAKGEVSSRKQYWIDYSLLAICIDSRRICGSVSRACIYMSAVALTRNTLHFA